MADTIPLRDDLSRYRFTVSLSDVVYELKIEWNVRSGKQIDEGWFFTIAEANGNNILAGLALQPYVSLIKRYRDTRLPPGQLMLMPNTGITIPPNRNNLVSGFTLFYLEDSDVAIL